MIRELYEDIRKRIQDQLGDGVIKHVAFWNNQPAHENEEQPYERPAVFIEINDIAYMDYTQKGQKFTANVKTRVVVEEYEDENLDYLDLKQDVAKCLHGYQPLKGAGSAFQPLTRTAERIDYEHNNLIIFETDYAATGQDNQLKDTYKTVQVNTLEINTALDIDNNTVQTGDGQE